jgi:2-hydroxy-3-oxopropionate reductase
MARRLLDRGHVLIVHDVRPAAIRPLVKLGARAANSAREVADRASIVLISVPNPQIVRDVALGAGGVGGGRAVKLVVDLCTNGARFEKELAHALAARGIDLIDAPISGGASGAAKGTLAVMCAGKPRAIADVRELLEAFGKVFVVGTRPGQAQTMKLLNNLLSTTALAISSEAFVAGAKAGLDCDMMVEVFNAGSGRNSATQEKIPCCVLPRTFDFGHPIAGALKDVGLAIDECEALGVPMRVGAAVRGLWQYAYAQGGGARDMTALITYIESWAGVEVVGKARGRRAARR